MPPVDSHHHAATAVTTATEKVRCSFNLLDPERPDAERAPAQSTWLDIILTETVDGLKQRISRVINLPTEQFRIYRKTGSGASGKTKELVNYNETLKEADMSWGGARNRLLIEKGVAPTQGVHTVNLVWIEYKNDCSWPMTRQLGTVEVHEKDTVAQVKEKLVPVIQKSVPPPPDGAGSGTSAGTDTGGCMVGIERTDGVAHLRLREDKAFACVQPHKMLIDDEPLAGSNGQIHMYKYSRKTLFVEALPGVEPKKDAKCVVLHLQAWSPSLFSVGHRQEMLITPEETVNQVRERLELLTVSLPCPPPSLLSYLIGRVPKLTRGKG